MRNLSDITVPKISTVLRKKERENVLFHLLYLSEKSRREGLLALEDDLWMLGKTFPKRELFSRGLQWIIDGTEPERVRNFLLIFVDKSESNIDKCINYAIAKGIISIQEGDNPRMLNEIIQVILELECSEDELEKGIEAIRKKSREF